MALMSRFFGALYRKGEMKCLSVRARDACKRRRRDVCVTRYVVVVVVVVVVAAAAAAVARGESRAKM